MINDIYMIKQIRIKCYDNKTNSIKNVNKKADGKEMIQLLDNV